jgi:hypothetical protein
MFRHPRASMYDLEAELREIFLEHPLAPEDGVHQTEGGERVEGEIVPSGPSESDT